MAITSSTGYAGTVNAVQAAIRDQFHGAAYAVGGVDDWRVTVLDAVNRTLSVAAGVGFGRHVLDVNDGPVQVGPLPSTAGWYLVVARRTWSSKVTAFTYVQGTSVKALPVGRKVNPGVEDDQPLALVQVNASGNIVPSSLESLRAWPSKVITVDSVLALTEDYPANSVARVAGRPYVFARNNVGTLEWAPSQAPRLKMYRSGSTGYPANSWIAVPFDSTVPDETNNAGADFTWTSGNRTVTINRQGRYLVEAVGRLTNEGAVRVTTSTGVTFCAGEINQPLGMASFCGSLTLPAGATLKMEQFAYFADTKDAAGASLTVTRMD